jgi:4-amino-4-deoxy-L-arabinose transferase-like glycosyltransferase
MRADAANIKRIIILIGLSYLFFMAGNGTLSLTNPDEVFYVQTAKEMAQHKSWMTPYLFGSPQFEKPVLLFWLLRIGFIMFGISSFSSRFFPAVFATLGVLGLYWLGLAGFKNEKKAFISSLVLMSCGFYVGMARSVFTDMIFSVLILLSLAAFFWAYTRKENKGAWIILSFVFCALAVLAKGPLGALIPLLTVGIFLFVRKGLRFFVSKYFLWGIFIFALISLPWYIFAVKRYGTSFINEFFYNDHFRRIIEAEHASNDTWYFYPLSILTCIFPWSLYALISLVFLARRVLSNKDTPAIYNFLASWICAVLLIFQGAHSKLISYILPLLPALAMLCADFIYEAMLSENRKRVFKITSAVTVIILFLIPLASIIILSKYTAHFPNTLPIYIFILAFLSLASLMLFFLIRGKFAQLTYLTVSVILVFLLLIPFVRDDIEPYVSSRYACQYLLKNYNNIAQPVLCSKPFVRGVRYYTGKEVAILSAYGQNFFSPHPIPFVDSDDKIRNFLSRNPVNYCILRKSALEDIRRALDKNTNLKIDVLKIIGNEYIVKIGPDVPSS